MFKKIIVTMIIAMILLISSCRTAPWSDKKIENFKNRNVNSVPLLDISIE